MFAGVLGIDPAPFSFGQLRDMHYARVSETWSQTSEILAMVFNTRMMAKNDKVMTAADFNPTIPADVKRAQRTASRQQATTILDQMFGERHGQ